MLPPSSPFIYQPSRRTQPYRQGQGQPGFAQQAMQRGATLYGQNPADQQRAFQTHIPGTQPPREGSLWWHLLNLSATNPTMPR